MGYRMEYGTGNNDAVFRKVGSGGKKKWIAAVLAAVLLAGGYLQRERLVDYLLPGDGAATRKAIEIFVSQLKAGEGAAEAFAAFCKVIIHEAELS